MALHRDAFTLQGDALALHRDAFTLQGDALALHRDALALQGLEAMSTTGYAYA
ncbi:MAG: hypothetical protein V7K30_12455 [Nostoc sp.]